MAQDNLMNEMYIAYNKNTLQVEGASSDKWEDPNTAFLNIPYERWNEIADFFSSRIYAFRVDPKINELVYDESLYNETQSRKVVALSSREQDVFQLQELVLAQGEMLLALQAELNALKGV